MSLFRHGNTYGLNGFSQSYKDISLARNSKSVHQKFVWKGATTLQEKFPISPRPRLPRVGKRFDPDPVEGSNGRHRGAASVPA